MARNRVAPECAGSSNDKVTCPGMGMEYLLEAEKAELSAKRLTDPWVDEALTQLERIVTSQKFERVQQRARDFLCFVVAKTLLMRAHEIKEVTIAIAVYREDTDYQPAVSTKVRVAARELRQRLVEYYASEGETDPIEVQLPRGTYVPRLIERHPTVAVDVFENWNPSGNQKHLCTTLSDEIAHQLTQSGLARAARLVQNERNGRFRYGLRGSVICQNGLVRLNLFLFDSYTNLVIFSGAFEEEREYLFKLTRRASESILEALASETGVEHPVDRPDSPERFEALQLYLLARFRMSRRTAPDLREAIRLLEQAIDINPHHARAYSGMADCLLLLNWYEGTTSDRVWFGNAKAHALKALALNAGLPEVHTSLAYAKLLCDFDWAGAEEDFLQAIRIDNRYAPAHHWYGNLLVMRERFEQAEEEMKRALYLDPGSIVIRKTVGDPYYYSRHYEQAIDRYAAALKSNPTFWMAHLFLGWSYQQVGEPVLALKEFEAVTQRSGVTPIMQGAIGHLYATSGRESEALAIVDHLKGNPEASYVPAHTLAVIYAGLGDKDQAFEWLGASYANRIELLGWIKVDPRFDNLRADRRFDQFLERIGLIWTSSNSD